MTYGVIVCPRCTLVLGADLSMARVTCPRCGNKIDVKKAKVYFSTDSPLELAEGVRQVGEKLVYDIEVPQAPAPQTERETVETLVRVTDEQSLRTLVQRLAEGKDALTRDDLMEGLGIGEGDIDDVIQRTLSAGIIYEASTGRYRPA
jgi:hypothetical protein